MADFPTSIFDPRTVENLPGISYDAAKTQNLFAEDINDATAEIVAIEETLGENPQGSEATVADRLDSLDTLLQYPISDLKAILQLLGSSWKATVADLNPVNISSAASWSSSMSFIGAVLIREAMTITGVTWWQQQNGTYTATNYNGVALCTFSGGVLTVVASSTSDNSIWATGFQSWVKKAFASAYAAQPGVYFIMAIYSRSSASVAPTFGYAGSIQNNGDQTLDFPNSRLLMGTSSAPTSLPATKNFSDFVASTNKWFFAVY